MAKESHQVGKREISSGVHVCNGKVTHLVTPGKNTGRGSNFRL